MGLEGVVGPVFQGLPKPKTVPSGPLNASLPGCSDYSTY